MGVSIGNRVWVPLMLALAQTFGRKGYKGELLTY